MTSGQLCLKILHLFGEGNGYAEGRSNIEVEELEHNIYELIQQAKSEWCKQQRANCVQAYYDNDDPSIGNITAISNAPEP